jgi:hypothetical protein
MVEAAMWLRKPTEFTRVNRFISLLLALSLPVGTAFGQPRAEEPKMGVHLMRLPGEDGSICGSLGGGLPCNLEESHLKVQGEVRTGYWVYVLAMNVPDSAGISGAAFGISYGENIVVSDWISCADQERPGPEPWTASPPSGSGTVLTWDTCRNTPAAGDMEGDVTAVAGAFFVTAYGDDRFSLTLRSYGAKPDLAITRCDGTTIELYPQRDAGSAGFGGGYGRDPCRSAYFPAARFAKLSPLDLRNIQVKLCTLRYSLHRINSLVLAGSGDSIAVRNFSNLARIKHLCVNDLSVAGMPEWDPAVVNPGLGALSAVIDSALADPVVRTGGVDTSSSYLSFAILDVPTGEGFEAILGLENAKRLIARVLPALEDTGKAYEAALMFACRTGLAPYDSSTNLTERVRIIPKEIRRDEGSTDHYSGEVVVENTTDGVFRPPVTLIVGPALGIDVLNADGCTCVLGGGGYWFDIPSLAPGERHVQIVRYLNPDESPIDVTYALFAGAKYR